MRHPTPALPAPTSPVMRLHHLVCVLAVAAVSWALLCPDPWAPFGGLRLKRMLAVGDFLQHAIAFGLLAAGCSTLAARLNGSTGKLLIGLLLYATSTELLQALIPGRSPDAGDLVANLVGIAAGIAVTGVIRLAWSRETAANHPTAEPQFQ